MEDYGSHFPGIRSAVCEAPVVSLETPASLTQTTGHTGLPEFRSLHPKDQKSKGESCGGFREGCHE